MRKNLLSKAALIAILGLASCQVSLASTADTISTKKVTWEDIANEMCCTKQTLYNKLNQDQHQTVNEYLEQNKSRVKQYIRTKLVNTKSVAGLIAVYKLLATQDERQALAMNTNNNAIFN